MKIEKSSNSFIPPSQGETSTRVPLAKQSDTPATPQGVSVNLGSTTNQIRNLESTVASTPAVDAKKVADIKQAISEGRFQINSSAIADSLINDVNDLISADQR
jgi:negative regulator of flagellin synthesis FlgM